MGTVLVNCLLFSYIEVVLRAEQLITSKVIQISTKQRGLDTYQQDLYTSNWLFLAVENFIKKISK